MGDPSGGRCVQRRKLLVDVLLRLQFLDQALHARLRSIGCAGQRRLHLLGRLRVVAFAAGYPSQPSVRQPVVGILLRPSIYRDAKAWSCFFSLCN